MKLYKYSPINKYTISNLVHKRNWVADPFQFNDPFEFCKRANYKLGAEGVKFLSKEEKEYKDTLEEMVSEFGVVCYSEIDYNNSIMWSHYGDKHTGICLVFELTEQNNDYINRVNYERALPDLVLEKGPSYTQQNLYKIATTKSVDWEYEKEWRQISLAKNGLADYPGDLTQIVFGLRCSVDDMRLIWKLLIPIYGKGIEFVKMEIQEGAFNLKSSAVPKENNDINNFPVWLESYK